MMFYTKFTPSFIVLIATLFICDLAVANKHRHGNNIHIHPLPSSGIKHIHTGGIHPGEAVLAQNPTSKSKKVSKSTSKNKRPSKKSPRRPVEKTLPIEVIATPPAPKRSGWKAKPVLVGKLHPSTLQVLCSRHGPEYNPSVSALNIKGKRVGSWSCLKVVTASTKTGPLINKNAACKLQWPTSNFFIGTPLKGYEHTWQCMRWVWKPSTTNKPPITKMRYPVVTFHSITLTGSHNEAGRAKKLIGRHDYNMEMTLKLFATPGRFLVEDNFDELPPHTQWPRNKKYQIMKRGDRRAINITRTPITNRNSNRQAFIVAVQGWDVDKNPDDFMGNASKVHYKSANWGAGTHTISGRSKNGSFKVTYSIRLH